MKEVSNQYAAMPSMHIGWSTWTRARARAPRAPPLGQGAVVLYPVITLVCILLTANHYWIDGVGGLGAWRPATRWPGVYAGDGRRGAGVASA